MRKLVSLGIIVLLAACSTKSKNVSGVYVNTSESSYSVATTTLTIDKASKDAKDLYTVKKDVVYARKKGKTGEGKDSLGKQETKPTEFLSGKFDADNLALTVSGYEDPFVLIDDGAKLKFKDVIYERK
ncbi:hypothetical protein [Chitinophaga rhizophila]|uniref:NlpE-like protein n=1 Tax=Chitinophaga rhizophila TaxID=2866212 RepID=A0ABS7G731_9BACT|nr:hypothetical protein [Chitinophaga rhizophila]MBW8683449.1 hypothetical protein [Chitinophaga rhizophila]